MKFAVVMAQEDEESFLLTFELNRDRLVRMRDLCHEHALWEVAQTLSDYTETNLGEEPPAGVFINSESLANDYDEFSREERADPCRSAETMPSDWLLNLISVNTRGDVHVELRGPTGEWWGHVGSIEEILAHMG